MTTPKALIRPNQIATIKNHTTNTIITRESNNPNHNCNGGDYDEWVNEHKITIAFNKAGEITTRNHYVNEICTSCELVNTVICYLGIDGRFYQECPEIGSLARFSGECIEIDGDSYLHYNFAD